MNKLFNSLLLLTPFSLFAQFYPIDQINPELKKEAYAIIRNAEVNVQLNASNDYKFSEEVVISVFEKSGDDFVDARQYYNPNTKIDAFEVEIYDAQGKSVRKYKTKDLVDVSAVSNGQLYTDDRIKYFEYTPVFYPYTVRYKIQTSNKNTLFLPRWTPITYQHLAIENSKFTFANNSSSTTRHIEKNLQHYPITKSEFSHSITYHLKDVKAHQSEELMLNWRKRYPQVIFATNQINIDGTQGNFDNWEDYGKWSYQNLIKSKLDLTPAQKMYFQDLVKTVKTDEEKVKILYQYLQKKVRYIGVQLGIGGLSPFPNSYVESKSYGDCKALSNYLIGMLDAVGIKAYHTILFADSNPVDIDAEMMYQQGNHMIVYVPLKDQEIWLEATSQSAPFNYLGEFAGNRNVYIFDETGGKIIPSQQFNHQNNLLISKGKIEIDLDGKTNFELIETAKGVFFDQYAAIENYIEKDKLKVLHQKFLNLSQPEFTNYSFDKSWDHAEFTTFIKAKSNSFGKKQGKNLIFNLIPINNETTSLKKAKERLFDFEIKRGYTDIMEFEIILPTQAKNELNIDPIELKSEFGTYILTLEKIEASKYILKRKYQQFKGSYDKSKYNDYVEFRRQVSANDNIKTLLEL